MAGILTLGGLGSGHAAFPPHKSVQGSPNVFSGGKPVHRQGDLWAPHQFMGAIHTSVLAKGSSTVFVNGKPCGRIGDPVGCGSIAIEGSTTVFVGG